MFDLERAPNELSRLFQQLQEWTIQDISRRITKAGQYTSTAEYMLAQGSEFRLFDENLQEQIQITLRLAEEETRKLNEKTLNSRSLFDKRVFAAHGMLYTPAEQNFLLHRMIDNFYRQTNGTFVNLTRSMGFAVQTPVGVRFKPIAQFYQQELDLALTKVYSGLDTLPNAVKTATNTMANSGLRAVDYATGHGNRIDVAARRAVLSGLRDVTNTQSEYNAGVLGTTVYEISWHGGHRPSHGWGGMRYDTTGRYYPTPDELFAQNGGGTPDDYNCYHILYATFADVPPNYSSKQLVEMEEKENALRNFEGVSYTAYEARQQQRKFERAMRTQRSKIAGLKGGNQQDYEIKEAITAAKSKYRQQRSKYKEFNAAVGLRSEYDRVYTGAV